MEILYELGVVKNYTYCQLLGRARVPKCKDRAEAMALEGINGHTESRSAGYGNKAVRGGDQFAHYFIALASTSRSIV
jgi:hypothetical protein